MQLPPLILKEVREAPNPQEEESPDKQRNRNTAASGRRVTPCAKRKIMFAVRQMHDNDDNERRSGSVTKKGRIGTSDY